MELVAVLNQGTQLEVIVVNNDQDRGVGREMGKLGVECIENARNMGFAFACNQVALRARGEWVLFLNPDVEISPDQIDQLREYAVEQKLVAVSPSPADGYAKPLPSIYSLLAEFTPLKFLDALVDKSTVTLVGGCLLIKKEVLVKLGGWDERFFLWFEDSDLTRRLSDLGYGFGRAPITIVHQGGGSLKKLSKQLQRDLFFNSLEIYAKKHFWQFSQLIANQIKYRYTSQKILPTLEDDQATIVVPNMKEELLESFLKKNFTATRDIQLIVISSALTNASIWKWRERYPTVRFIRIEKNEGFAKTVNVGLRVATSAWRGTVNDDVLLDTFPFTKMIRALPPKTGSFNPVIYGMDSTIESAGIVVKKYGKAFPITQFPHKTITQVDATNGAAVMYNALALGKVGIFDEKFHSYLEDIDLSIRLQRSGWKNVVVSFAKVFHAKHQTSNALGKYKQYLDFKNWILVILKNWSVGDLIFYFPSIFIERLRNLSGVFK